MISNDLKQIVLLNPVRVNYDLKKWNPDSKKGLTESRSDEGLMVGGGMSSPMWQNGSNPNIWDGVPFVVQRQFTSPVWRKIVDAYIRFRLIFNNPKKDSVEFFMEVKDNFSELEEVKIDDAKIKEMITNLEKTNQKYAIATLRTEKSLQQLENKLVEGGFIQYQTEESLIKFIKQCKKGLCLKEIESFDRVIPDNAMKKFDKAEELGIFDNYYILFNDPNGADNIFYTTEPPKPKDPIMFGVIRGSNKLYLVADWIDEFCNLTYKDILKKGVDYKLKKEGE